MPYNTNGQKYDVTKSKCCSRADSRLWSGTTWLPMGVEVQFRYYIGVMVDDKVIISQREVSLMPRVIEKDGKLAYKEII